jgi:hypothetical protein
MSSYIIVIVDFCKVGAIIANELYYSISMSAMKEERKKERKNSVLCSIFSRHIGVPFLGGYI